MLGTAFVTKAQVFQSGTGITKWDNKHYYKASNKYY